MDTLDTDKLNDALDNESNEFLLNFTTKTIQQMNLDVLNQLYYPKHKLVELLKKLRDYRYVDELKELKYGTYIRWIPIHDPNNLELTKGGIFCEIKTSEKGTNIIYKNFFGKHFSFKIDECLVFQKLTKQEKVLLSALDHLSLES